jgi:hypothetical protein
MVHIPDARLSVIVLFNLFLWNTRSFALEVADQYLGDGQDPKPAEIAGREPAPPLSSPGGGEGMTGVYFNEARAALRTITLEGGTLCFEGFALARVGDDRFRLTDEPHVLVEFGDAVAGVPQRVRTITPSGEYSYRRVETVAPSDLEPYAGRYYSPELDVWWTLKVAGDNLEVTRRKYPDSMLTPVFVDAFSDDWTPLMGYPTSYLLLFDRDDLGRIRGLRVTGARVRNLQFDRIS